MTTTKRKKKQKSGHIVAVLLIIFCLGLLGFGVFLFLQETGVGRSPDTIGKIFQVDELDPAARTGIMPGSPSREHAPGDSLFGYRINTSPVFNTGGKGDISIENPAFNQYLLVLEITRTEDPALLYQSRYIAPNQYIEDIQLSSVPSPGTYDAIAYLNLVDPKTMGVVDILECPLKLTIKEK